MKTAILEVYAVDMAKAVGFRRIEPTGPAGERFGLYLPSIVERLTDFGQIVHIIGNKIMDPAAFPYSFSYVTINSGHYARNSKKALAMCLCHFPMTEDCRINAPVSFVLGEKL